MTTLFINACVRPESRTVILAQEVLKHLSGDIQEVKLAEENLLPFDNEMLLLKNELLLRGETQHSLFRYARQFAAADNILIAAPYWDLSFPALLKNYIESICVVGLTFAYDEEEKPYGMCTAKKLIYVTTAGGPIVSEHYGFGYIREVGRLFFQIPSIECFFAEGLDLKDANVDEIMDKAIEEIRTALG